jgi:hypothetical protein
MWYSGVTGQKMRRYPGLKVMVDGAHMLGQVPVDVNSMHADYFATNCHKWLCGARGSAVLWVAETAQAGFEPLVKSHGHGSGFTSDFIWSGVKLVLSCCRTNTTSVICIKPAEMLDPVLCRSRNTVLCRNSGLALLWSSIRWFLSAHALLCASGAQDYAPYLASGCALIWWRKHGASAHEYMRSLLLDAVELLVDRFQSCTLAPISACARMACVRLPDGLQTATRYATAPESVDAKSIQVRKIASHGYCTAIRRSVALQMLLSSPTNSQLLSMPCSTHKAPVCFLGGVAQEACGGSYQDIFRHHFRPHLSARVQHTARL